MPEAGGGGSGPGPRSERAREASRRNGAKSRGPRSAAGKRAASGNARKHGLRARHVEILRAVPPQLADLAAGLRAACEGNGDAMALAERILVAELSRQRAAQLLDETLSQLIAPESEMMAFISRLPRRLPVAQADDLEAFTILRASIDTDWCRCQMFMAYEKRFRGQRDRGLREFNRLYGSSRG